MGRDHCRTIADATLSRFLRANGCHWLLAWVSFLALALLFRWLALPAGEHALMAVLPLSLLFSILYTGLYALLLFGGVWRWSLLWLVVPYFLFALGWLRWYWALPCVLVWSLAVCRTAVQDNPVPLSPGKWHLLAVLLVTAWVYLSGAGNHGNQSPDYAIHNGRLFDLVQFSWPLQYTEGLLVQHPDYGPRYTYLVGYNGYFLPAALWGKLAGYDAAQEFLHLWTLVGCWLALLWLWEFAGRAMPVGAALLLMLFGGLDIAGVLLNLAQQPGNTSLAVLAGRFYEFWRTLSYDTGNLDFWPVGPLGFFFGNYLSNAGEFYWSPHQTIAAWVAGGLLMQAFLAKRVACVAFLFALLAYWSPMNLMTVALFPLLLVLQDGQASLRQSLTVENIAGGGLILLLCGVYYFSGSAGVNPFSWLWDSTDLARVWWKLLYFHLVIWGLYAVQVLPGLRRADRQSRLFFAGLCLSLFSLSWISYGTYNDLLCRGSAILMFFMLVMVLRRLVALQAVKSRLALATLWAVVALGSWSSLQHFYRSFLHFDEKQGTQSIINSIHGWEYLGPVDSVFVRYLSKDTAVMSGKAHQGETP